MEQAKKENALLPEGQEASHEITQSSVAATPKSFFWFVAHGSLLKGPYSTTELKRLADKKEVSEKSYVWRDGYREWRPFFGVEEFMGGKESSKSHEYPSVPVPGMRLTPPSLPVKAPVYTVRFAQSRWSEFKKTEVLGFFLVSLAFTYAVLFMVGHYFEFEWDRVWGRRMSGTLYTLGKVETALPTYMMNPLLSAPGLAHVEEEWVPVELEGDINRQEALQIGAYKIETEMPPQVMQNLNWDKSFTYTRRVKVQGMLDLKNPTTIHVESPGLPFEPLLSKRRAHP